MCVVMVIDNTGSEDRCVFGMIIDNTGSEDRCVWDDH